MRFTEALTSDLYQISKDKHLRVEFGPQIFNRLREPDSLSRDDLERRIRNEANQNFGFQKAERLEGNVGYVDLRKFSNARWAGATAVAGMTFLGSCDALIIDLRKNHGGDASMIQLLSSYLFDDPQHINDFYCRSENKTEQSWTQAYVPGKKLVESPCSS